MATEKKTAVKKVAAKKTVVKAAAKAAAPKAAAKGAVARKTAKKAETPVDAAPVTREDRFRQIEMEAFLLAEKDDFKADPLCYWIAAERKVLQATG